ncbi:hypothetical protein GCM10007160_39340 [Litchfieldella qijiaojingensis]|uniref:Uncharacterized protein n=1 Tax=Litchfieldella qijiaojingensis TaxID=980347 RepID=A0ABQ2ZAY7_9GAMM|nr:AbrB family transcriptional regulator [Halomonas qijiaojingensis]GGY08017.1 hypothetical protein GCM10007160_39340 [Halomonas qijiaojingensis]
MTPGRRTRKRAEQSWIALSLGIASAFVTSHHLLRIMMLILLMPVLLSRFKRLSA